MKTKSKAPIGATIHKLPVNEDAKRRAKERDQVQRVRGVRQALAETEALERVRRRNDSDAIERRCSLYGNARSTLNLARVELCTLIVASMSGAVPEATVAEKTRMVLAILEAVEEELNRLWRDELGRG